MRRKSEHKEKKDFPAEGTQSEDAALMCGCLLPCSTHRPWGLSEAGDTARSRHWRDWGAGKMAAAGWGRLCISHSGVKTELEKGGEHVRPK